QILWRMSHPPGPSHTIPVFPDLSIPAHHLQSAALRPPAPAALPRNRLHTPVWHRQAPALSPPVPPSRLPAPLLHLPVSASPPRSGLHLRSAAVSSGQSAVLRFPSALWTAPGHFSAAPAPAFPG